MTEYPKRKPFLIPMEGYRHMRRSLIRFCGVDELDVVPLLYPLYIGNLDTCQYHDVPLTMMELSEDGFWSVILSHGIADAPIHARSVEQYPEGLDHPAHPRRGAAIPRVD